MVPVGSVQQQEKVNSSAIREVHESLKQLTPPIGMRAHALILAAIMLITHVCLDDQIVPLLIYNILAAEQ